MSNTPHSGVVKQNKRNEGENEEDSDSIVNNGQTRSKLQPRYAANKSMKLLWNRFPRRTSSSEEKHCNELPCKLNSQTESSARKSSTTATWTKDETSPSHAGNPPALNDVQSLRRRRGWRVRSLLLPISLSAHPSADVRSLYLGHSLRQGSEVTAESIQSCTLRTLEAETEAGPGVHSVELLLIDTAYSLGCWMGVTVGRMFVCLCVLFDQNIAWSKKSRVRKFTFTIYYNVFDHWSLAPL